MVKFITSTARRLDAWLHSSFGRGYKVLLTVGLIGDIGHRLMEKEGHARLFAHPISIAADNAFEKGA